jgi:hypothetical protein
LIKKFQFKGAYEKGKAMKKRKKGRDLQLVRHSARETFNSDAKCPCAQTLFMQPRFEPQHQQGRLQYVLGKKANDPSSGPIMDIKMIDTW